MSAAMHPYLLGPGGFEAGAALPLSDRGFRYGMSVFETVALRDSAPLLFDEHVARLAETAAAAGLRAPDGWAAAARATLAAPPIAEGVARLYLTAGDRDGQAGRAALLCEALPIATELASVQAISVEFAPALPFGKTGNYWPHFLARPANGDEAILCAPSGHLLGGSMSNLFVILDGTLLTPRAPVRRGVVRDWVLAAGGGSVAEADLTRADLARATAAFLTNSRLGLCALTAIDGRPLAPDPRIEKLWTRYRREVLRAG